MTKKIKAYAYQGTHEDERALANIGHVSKGTVIVPLDDKHAERMEESGLFKVTSAPAPTPAEPADTEAQKETQ